MAQRLRHLSLEPRSLIAGYPLSCEVCVGDSPNCRGKLQTCAPDEDSCIVVVTETNRRGQGLVSDPGEVAGRGGGGAFRVAGIARRWEGPLSDDTSGKRERQSQGGWWTENPME